MIGPTTIVLVLALAAYTVAMNMYPNNGMNPNMNGGMYPNNGMNPNMNGGMYPNNGMNPNMNGGMNNMGGMNGNCLGRRCGSGTMNNAGCCFAHECKGYGMMKTCQPYKIGAGK